MFCSLLIVLEEIYLKILQIVDSTRFMASSLSNLVNNLSEGIDEIKWKYGHNDKKCETCGIKYNHCDGFLEYTDFEDDLTEYKYLYWKASFNISLMKS